jgi:hypothetical protein
MSVAASHPAFVFRFFAIQVPFLEENPAGAPFSRLTGTE